MAGERTDTSKINEWRSIVTLIVFVLTNINVLFPFHIPIPVPRWLVDGSLAILRRWRIISPKQDEPEDDAQRKTFVRLQFPMNFVTGPLIADLFLLAIGAIGRKEVKDGTVGDETISPLDIMIFFFTLAYIAISIDASGLIRWLAFKVLQWGGKIGHKLFFYLYAFFFVIGSFIGNDPIVLSGTAFLAYMTRVSSNIIHPRAWIHTQFAIANIASAILVSSNPTNLVLAGAFSIRFVDYTVNMIVPVVVTAIVLFPFLLYVVFANPDLIPNSIEMHELPEELRTKKPVNPNIPHARGISDEEESIHTNDEQGKLMSLEEIMNPYIDWGGAAFGGIIMASTLIVLLALNAATSTDEGVGEHAIFWVTLPAAFVMLCWDLAFGWIYRKETRRISAEGKRRMEESRAQRERTARENEMTLTANERDGLPLGVQARDHATPQDATALEKNGTAITGDEITPAVDQTSHVPPRNRGQGQGQGQGQGMFDEKQAAGSSSSESSPTGSPSMDRPSSLDIDLEKREEEVRAYRDEEPAAPTAQQGPVTLVSRVENGYSWAQETFPTVTAVLAHLPFALIPFAFAMFVLVQALVTKGWVPVFGYGWDYWVKKTGTVGAVGGMGFLSVILCNFAGTNIGTTILLCRVVQSWLEIRQEDGIPISNRTFWATVYSMALGVNYGAFSTAFSASLAGLLWRDILERKHIHVKAREFARENIPIIAIAMTVGCAVLIGEVYLIQDTDPVDIAKILAG